MRRMLFSRIWGRVDSLLTDVSEELHRSLLSYTLKMEAIRSSETSVNKMSTRRHIPKDGIFLIFVPVQVYSKNKTSRSEKMNIQEELFTSP
jgi:hypothetical protein